MRFGTGVEGTSFPHHPIVNDIYELVGHIDAVESDLALVTGCGFREYRAEIPWHRIQPAEQGPWDWSWTDRLMAALDQQRFDRVIFDLCHHVAIPKWLDGGFLDPRFSPAFVAFCRSFAERYRERYPWMEWFNVMNEPFTNTLFSGLFGHWLPFRRSDRDFVAMVIVVGQAIHGATRAIQEVSPGAKFLHNDSCEYHQAEGSPDLEAMARFFNERRFLFHHLLRGKITADHPLHGYLADHGFTPAIRDWFLQHPTPVDEVGLHYYDLHEHYYAPHGDLIGHAPGGLFAVGKQYAHELQTPILVGEINIAGTLAERLLWYLLQLRDAEKLARAPGVTLRGFHYWGFLDARSWETLCTNPHSGWDHFGLVPVDPRTFERHVTPLYEIVRLLATGAVGVTDVPLPRPDKPFAHRLRGYLQRLEEEEEPVTWARDEREVLECLAGR